MAPTAPAEEGGHPTLDDGAPATGKPDLGDLGQIGIATRLEDAEEHSDDGQRSEAAGCGMQGKRQGPEDHDQSQEEMWADQVAEDTAGNLQDPVGRDEEGEEGAQLGLGKAVGPFQLGPDEIPGVPVQGRASTTRRRPDRRPAKRTRVGD